MDPRNSRPAADRRAGYWITEFLSISSIVAKARGRDRRAYLYSETDDNDLTYFVLWHLSVVVSAIDRLGADLRRKQQQIVDVESRLKRTRDFNHRQLALLAHALRHPNAIYTAQIHATSHGVALQTARNDLDRLVAKRLLRRVQQAKKFTYLPTPNLAQRFG
ncbi:MAG: hypothetical protein U0V87_12370 [Acidobacteriota bacterium]